MDNKKLMDYIIIDGYNLLYRVVYKVDALKIKHKTEPVMVDGFNVAYIDRFLGDMYDYINNFLKSKSEVIIVWDRRLDPNVPNWRNKIIPSYKCNDSKDKHLREKIER